MAGNDKSRAGWHLEVGGSRFEPDEDRITLSQYAPPRIHLDIGVSGIRSQSADQKALAHQAIRDALLAIQKALESPGEIAGLGNPQS